MGALALAASALSLALLEQPAGAQGTGNPPQPSGDSNNDAEAGGPGAPPVAVNTRAHVMSWCPVPEDCTNITKMVSITQEAPPSYFAEQSLQTPAGYRYLLTFMTNDLTNHPQDVCRNPDGSPTSQMGVWPENGVAAVRARHEQFLSQFVAAGGQADAIVSSHEDAYGAAGVSLTGGTARWQAIQNDPRFAALGAELGFNSVTDIEWGSPQYHQWNSVLAGRHQQALNDAVYEPFQQYFPGAIASNYPSCIVTEANAIPDFEAQFGFFETDGYGTHNAYEFFGAMGSGMETARLDGVRPFGRSPYSCLLMSVNQLRGIRRSSDRPVHPWITMYNYLDNGDSPGRFSPLCLSRYYEEFVRHLVMHNCPTLLLWNPQKWRPEQRAQDWNQPQDARRLDRVIADLNERLEGQWIGNIALGNVPWDSRVIATGLRVDDRVVWRFTFAPEVSDTTVYLDGQPVRIAPDPGQKGAWFTHPVTSVLNLAPDQSLPQMQVTSSPNVDPRNNLRRSFFVMKLNRKRG
jgi:hypothetical protein